MHEDPLHDRIVVAVPTFRRADRLDKLLGALTEQTRSLTGRGCVVVADNDPEGSAGDVVRRWADKGVRYVHEPRPGLAAVRNRLLDEAGAADAVVFIDDDEMPSTGWLSSLLAAWRTYRSAAVSGPVRSVFAVEPEPTLLASGVFDRARRATGESMKGGASNNLLLDLDWLRKSGLRFDPEFGESGGEDTMLTHSIIARGGQIRWCDEAEVTELVPADRLTQRWVRQRIVRTSNSWARVELKVGGTAGVVGRTLQCGYRCWLPEA